MDNNIELLDGIDIYLSGKRPGTVKSYGSFLKNFFSLLLNEYGWVMSSDLSVPECAERFETYCKENNYKESTTRSFRYALRSYLSFLHIELEPYDLSSKPWEERTSIITPSEFDRFLSAVDASCKNGEEAEIKLIACLAFYCGLSLNEILKLSSLSFYKSGSSYIVHVTGVSRKEKDRHVKIPSRMNEILLSVISSDPRPLFTLGRKENASDTSDAKKRKLQRIVEAAGKCMNQNGKAAKRYDLKALRSSRILTEIRNGTGRKEIMDTYGVSEFYISHILSERNQ